MACQNAIRRIGTEHVGIVFPVLMEQSIIFGDLRLDFFPVEVK